VHRDVLQLQPAAIPSVAYGLDAACFRYAPGKSGIVAALPSRTNRYPVVLPRSRRHVGVRFILVRAGTVCEKRILRR
jgi:hypothetical protein